ncbi:MAG: hypothetical protein V2J51_15760 [Erythrobacter sp.]|jgi:hypothetical protein|nr:hypothetical protein [Erythrobacter sp.]
MGRLKPLRDQLEENARIAAEDMGIEAVSYSAQIGPRGEYLLSAAMGPGGGVFFIAPFLGPYRGADGHDPWASVTMKGSAEVVAVCRIVVIRKPSIPLRVAKFEDFVADWPDHKCNQQQVDVEQRARFDEQLAKSGYSTFRETTTPDGGKAWLVELPDGDNSEFDVEKALDLVASDRRIVSSMPLFPFDHKMGVADLDDGTRLFFYDKTIERTYNPRVCVVQDIVWNEFATWRNTRGQGALWQWCDEALRAQTEMTRERIRKRWEGELGPVIQTTPIRSKSRD